MISCFARRLLGVLAALSCAAIAHAQDVEVPGRAAPGVFTLNKGDHVCMIGNALAERMQHEGWLETIVHGRLPHHELTFRNLGFAGDEVVVRQRSDGFGTPDEWLTRTQADVVLAFFGFNESFSGRDGLEAFSSDLRSFVRHTIAQRYSPRRPTRLVLLSPIAHEDLRNPNLPNGSESNSRLALYADAMAEVARGEGVMYVDLFAVSKRLYQSSESPLTINGIHLNAEGNRCLAMAIDEALFGKRPDKVAAPRLEAIRRAVVDKNLHWFHRYRTTDGYSSYGGRSHLKFVNGQTNREVMMRELEVLDRMTANRDRVIWAVAAGQSKPAVDENLPPLLDVVTNKPGPLPNGQHEFFDAEEAIAKMKVADGLKVNLFASEAMFPELIKPVQMSWDTKGRLWVAAWPSYPHWKPTEEMNDKLLILEDTDGDGQADRCTTFADHLHSPTGFEFWGGGVILAMAPDFVFLKDTDGDGKADTRERILHGIDSADTHHTANSFTLGPDGALYFQEGVFHRTQIETPYGPRRNKDACVWRFEPRTWKVERYVAYEFANPHGHVFDAWGRDIVHDGTGANPYDAALFSGFVEFPRQQRGTPQVYRQRTRPCPGTEILSSRHFPESMQGNLLVGNVIGFLGILQYQITDDGSSLAGNEVEPILSSSDPNFRPSDFEIGPDGALYFTDWHNPIIGHMQHNLRDPSRDHQHGRVYRVTHAGRPLSAGAKIAGEPIPRLLDLLKEPEDRVRYRTRIELNGRDAREVVQAVARWVENLDRRGPNYEHLLLEALWVHQQCNVPKLDLLDRVLESSNFRARAAATRVLGEWRDRVPNAMDRLRHLAADEHPRVRLEAVRAASFLTRPEALEIAVIAGQPEPDRYLAYTIGETLKTLEPHWKKALVAGESIPVTTEAGTRFVLRHMSVDQILAKQKTRLGYFEVLCRGAARDQGRAAALAGLEALEHKTGPEVLLEALAHVDLTPRGDNVGGVADLVRLLLRYDSPELTKVRPQVEQLAKSARQPLIRRAALAALVGIDRSTGKVWESAAKSVGSLRDLVAAVPLIADPGLQHELYPRVQALLVGLPSEMKAAKSGTGDDLGCVGRYVRVSLPRAGTLTLAEVEAYSGGKNVARRGTASQVNTAHGGKANRAIDGNTAGAYGAGGQSHTAENTPDPWWQVDLGDDFPLDAVVIFNRTERDTGQRLNGFTLTVLDSAGVEVFRRDGIEAPARDARIDLGVSGAEAVIRRAAMDALPSFRGKEVEVFQSLVKYAIDNVDRAAAVGAIRRIPPQFWPKDQARPLVDLLIADIRAIPVPGRTSPTALAAMQFADGLTSLLPVDEARQARATLRGLGVRVIHLAALPERMSYDQEALVLEAGQPVEIVFENPDLMPHNLVIAAPGSLEELGLLAESTAQQPGSAERHYVPVSTQVLASTPLLLSGQSHRLSFVAPKAAGVYPYVCTYPGHWRRMFGSLFVVESLDEYEADPERYLASHPLKVQDELLKNRRPRREWKADDLEADLGRQSSGRSFEVGRQMFQVANCTSCHRLNDVGQVFGPDLTKLDPPRTRQELLRDMLDPSARIDEKYRSQVFTTDEGKTITAMVVEETEAVVRVIENPLLATDVVVLSKPHITERGQVTASIMPKGLLDRLTREEILDLVAYVYSRGDQKNEVFRQVDGHNHHGH